MGVIGLLCENKSPRLGLRAFYGNKNIENEYNTFKLFKTDSKSLKISLNVVMLYKPLLLNRRMG